MISRNNIGDIVTFTYGGESIHDQFPQALILHNNWQGKVHALNLNYLLEAEIEYIKAIVNPDYAAHLVQTHHNLKAHLLSITTSQHLDFKSPRDFYLRFIRSFIKRYDSYRVYTPGNISNVRVIMKRDVLVGNKPGLFTDYQASIDKQQQQQQQPGMQNQIQKTVSVKTPVKKPIQRQPVLRTTSPTTSTRQTKRTTPASTTLSKPSNTGTRNTSPTLPTLSTTSTTTTTKK